MSDKKWWEPVLCDTEYFSRLRKDYPENAHMSDESLHDYYNDSRKYQILWDHIGDAYEEYEKLADAYLGYKQQLSDTEKALEKALDQMKWVSEKGWVQFAYTKLGKDRDSMTEHEVKIVQEFLGELPQPPPTGSTERRKEGNEFR